MPSKHPAKKHWPELPERIEAYVHLDINNVPARSMVQPSVGAALGCYSGHEIPLFDRIFTVGSDKVEIGEVTYTKIEDTSQAAGERGLEIQRKLVYERVK